MTAGRVRTRTGALLPRSLLWSSLAFLASGWMALWVAHDRLAAWGRFMMLALGVALVGGVPALVRQKGKRAWMALGVGSALLAGVVGLSFILFHDWTLYASGRVVLLRPIAFWLHGSGQGGVWGQALHRNAVAGALVILLPLGLAALSLGRQRSSRSLVWACALGLAPGVAALLLTASRGALLAGMVGGAVGLYLYGPHLPARAFRFGRAGRWEARGMMGAGLLLAFGSFWTAISLPGMEELLQAAGGPSAAGRLKVWREMLTLVGDYPLTGVGLGSTWLVYSSYVLLVPVAYFYHAHHLFLQVAVEQGIPGLLAFAWLMGAALFLLLDPHPAGGTAARFRPAVTASLVALLVHGLIEAELYMSGLLPLMFLPVGMAGALVTSGTAHGARGRKNRRGARARQGALLLLSAALLLLLPGPRALLLANLGTVAQNRAELARYRSVDWPVQDALRRAVEPELAPAIGYYRAALAQDPGSVTANRRLGQIELSLGHYEMARQHLEAAYRVAPGERATRQLLGELYAIEGRQEQAVALWASIDVSQGQLALRQWWYAQLGDGARAVRVKEAAQAASPAPSLLMDNE